MGENNENDYKLRTVVQEDCDLVFRWANDTSVRENSFNTKEIEYNDHINWFNEKLKSNDNWLYIFMDNNQDVGLIRLDKMEVDTLLINYSVAKEFRGKGYATALLKLIKYIFPTYHLIGKVKPNNMASIKAFTKAGYIVKDELEYKIFYS